MELFSLCRHRSRQSPGLLGLCLQRSVPRLRNSHSHKKPDTHSDGYEVKKLTGAPRYCRNCESYKPPRAHHCRQCDRSVPPLFFRRLRALTPPKVCSSYGCVTRIMPPNFVFTISRPSLPVDQQLRWPLQPRTLYSFPLLY